MTSGGVVVCVYLNVFLLIGLVLLTGVRSQQYSFAEAVLGPGAKQMEMRNAAADDLVKRPSTRPRMASMAACSSHLRERARLLLNMRLPAL